MKESNCGIKCPTHGTLSTRGMIFTGKVASCKTKNTAVVTIDYTRKVPKYERLEKRRSKIHVHVPNCVELKDGDTVRVSECRKLSKTKSHVVLEKVKEPNANPMPSGEGRDSRSVHRKV